MNENYIRPMGGSPGLVVMWGDSCSPNTGRTFSQLCGVNIVMFVWKTKINQNETWDGPLKVTFVQIRTHFLIIRLWSYAIRYSTLAMIFFLKKMGQSRPLFVYFCHFPITISITEKSIDGVLGIWTRGRRMVGADETTELWRPPLGYDF